MKTKLSLITIQMCALVAFATQDTKIEEIKIKDSALLEESLSNPKSTIKVEDEVTSSMNDALDKEFYVEFKKTSSYSSEPYIRGRGNKGVPVFIEGMRVNAGHDDSTNIFGMTDVSQIDVYRGANGAKLGMGAMSGAVVVKYKEPEFNSTQDFKVSGFVDGKYEFLSNDGYSSSIGTSVYNNLISASLSAGMSDYNNYEDGNSDEVLHSEYDIQNYNGSFAIKTGDDSYIYTRYTKNRAGSEDPYTRFLNSGTWTYTDRPDDESKTYFIGYREDEISGGFTNFDVQYFNNKSHYDINTKKEAIDPNQQELFRQSSTEGIKVSANKELGNHYLSLDGTYSDMDIRNGVRNYNPTTKTWGNWMSAFGITGGGIETYNLSLADDIHYDKLFFNLAAGYEYVKRDVTSNVNTNNFNSLIPSALLSEVVKQNTNEKDNLLSLSATVGYEIDKAFIPYLKLSNATRTPYFNEQYGNNPSNGSQIPNQDLDNEKVHGIDIGADGEIGNAYYSSALYYQEYKDYIELINTGYKTTANLPIKQFVNLDEATIYGAELMAGYRIIDDIYAEASYIYTKGENKDNNTSLAYITPQKVTLSLSQKKQKGLNWKLEEEFVDSQDKISSVNGEVATSGYALTNASIGYAFSKFGVFKSANVAFELNNIFDKNYREHLSKASSTTYYLPDEAGINGSLSINLKF